MNLLRLAKLLTLDALHTAQEALARDLAVDRSTRVTAHPGRWFLAPKGYGTHANTIYLVMVDQPWGLDAGSVLEAHTRHVAEIDESGAVVCVRDTKDRLWLLRASKRMVTLREINGVKFNLTAVEA